MRSPLDLIRTALLLGLAGCATPSALGELADFRAPAEWSGAADAIPAPAEKGAPSPAAPSFWQAFASPELERTVRQALDQNLDLRAALHRIEQARAQAKMSGSALWPALSAGGSTTRTLQDAGDLSRWQSTASLSYELDLFGRNRSASQSAGLHEQASGFDRDALRLVVSSDAASRYAELLAYNDRIRIAQGNLTHAEEVLRIIEARRGAGSASGLEVSQQRVAVNGLRSALAALVEQRTTTHDALAVLLGRAPQQVALPDASLASLAVPQPSLRPPAQLVADGRPDLRSAEAQLRAADADIRAARAAFFPTLQLGSDASLAALGLGNPTASALSLASNALAPIFSGGQLQGNLDNVTARQRELAAQYRKAVLTAFQEVEDALAAVASANQQAQLARDSMEQAQNAYRIADARFRAGSIDYTTLLETQRSLAQAEDGDVVARLARLEAVVQLHRALGDNGDRADTAPVV